MEICTVTLPPYLYSPRDAGISLVDNRRYTMRDIGKIEDRVENLERVTSLSLLELNTQTLQIRDAQGIERFKSGFFVDDFKNGDLIDFEVSSIEIDTENNELIPVISRNSLSLKLVSEQAITDEALDYNENFILFDPNVQKTGDAITLKYDPVSWIEQPLATKVENVNPFHIISYTGTIKLNPESDSWVRTIRLDDIIRTIRRTRNTGNRRLAGRRTTTTTTVDRILGSGTEIYMRSRNTGFKAYALNLGTRYYQFVDGNSGVDFIPKLLEISPDQTLQNYGSNGAFTVGEMVVGNFNGTDIIKFRVAKSNHKEGVFSAPSITYGVNPYVPSETIPSDYSSSSKILNIDVDALCIEAQGVYSGYVTTGTKLVGQSSGTVAYVKDLRLVSDQNGFLAGSFFLRDPLSSPPPAVRIETGSKIYKLTSSSTNAAPLPGSKLISSGEVAYRSEGTWELRQRTITNTITRFRFHDPLAQSFAVGGTADAENGNTPNEDSNGAYLTSVDLFFANKDSGNIPLTVEVRTIELGTPTQTVLGNPVILQPDQIQTSVDASVATKVTFDFPIYLAPGLQYCIVLLAPQSIQYEVWIAEMGEKTIETRNLPDAQSVRYTRQFGIGRLYKSQNGGEWTPNDYQDMKFNLYKAQFTSNAGSVLFHNPSLDSSNGYVPLLASNPITVLPKRLDVGINTITDSGLRSILTSGRKISESTKTYNYGYVVGTGCSASSVSVTSNGSNYVTDTDVSTYNIIGRGKNLTLNISAGTGGTITTATIVNPGTGYAIGDVVGIVTSSVSSNSGQGARVTITANNNAIDTLYLSNVQGSFTASPTNQLVYFNNSGARVSLATTFITSVTEVGGIDSGNFFRVNHFEHDMYANNNKLTLSGVESDVAPTTLTNPLGISDSTISIASTTSFATFEDMPVNGNNPGFIQIGNEIIKYEQVNVGLLGAITRGINSTKIESYNNQTLVYKYELAGISLLRINKQHDISDTGIEIDNHFIEIERTSGTNLTDRSADQGSGGSPANSPQLSFNSELSCGGNNIRSTENIQFDAVNPHVEAFTPASPTSISSQIRTISGTSVNGNEISFIDQGYEPVGLDVVNKLSSTRIVASNVNESTYLGSLLRNKSFTLKVDFATTDQNVSPLLFWKRTSAELLSNRINKPVSDYISDGRVNSILDDPHVAIYVSNVVRLSNPANTLKVLLSAYRHSSADFRVLYSLIRPDSSEVEQSFELFPGYTNLTIDNNQDGNRDVVDPSKNTGLPDVFVPDSLEDEFLEYEFTAGNLGNFTGYVIKIVMSSTDQTNPPRFRDLRSIAVV